MNVYLISRAVLLLWLLSLNNRETFAINQTVEVEVHLRSLATYTRIIVKSNHELKYKYFFLKNPERIAVDIEGVNCNLLLKDIKTQIRKNDPRIISVRTIQFNQKKIRIVSVIKNNVVTKLFLVAPTSGCRDRLLIDFYLLDIRNIQNPPLTLTKNYIRNDLNQQILQKQSTLHLEKKKPFIIMVDPGHGGGDYGAIGKNCTKEKDIVLQIAFRLKRLIDGENNMRAFMTRNEDVFIPLKVRVAKAKKQNSDLLVSIHTDAFASRQAIGSSVFVLSTKSATTSTEKYLSEIQNTYDLLTGVTRSGDYYVDHTILDMVQSLTIIDSMAFGNEVLRQISKINKLHKNNVEQASFEILKSPDIPSILVEVAFISNEEEERKLKTEKFQQEIAESIFKGIKAYLSSDMILSRCSKKN